MASFQKRGKSWQFTISRMIGGKSKPIRKGGFKTKKEAQLAAAEIETELSKGLVPITSETAFSQVFKDWLTIYKDDVKANTKARYLNTHKTIEDYFGDKPIQDITKREYQIFINKYAKTRTKTTVKKLNSHIRSCVQNAIDEGIIRLDFTRNVKISGLDSKRPEEKFLNYKESQKLLNYLNKHLHEDLTYYIILLALTTGMRFGEIVGLTRKDFNFKNNTITINKTWGYTSRMERGFNPTKNTQSIRTIKVDKKTMRVFKELFLRTPENIMKLVFYCPNSKFKVITNSRCNYVLKRVLKELKIDPINFHGLRHTHASILLYKNVSIYYISERLGHSDIETTLNVYAHVVKELRRKDEQQSVNIYEEMFG